MIRPSTDQRRLAVSLFLLVPLGFLTKIYSGPAETWVRNSLGGVLYEAFWIWLVLLFFQRLRPWKAAAWVFASTCCLEAAQLWHPLALERIRSTFMGRTLLGTTFSWGDFPHYAAGCLAAAAFALKIRRVREGAGPSGEPGRPGGGFQCDGPSDAKAVFTHPAQHEDIP
jgi:hypothetical protein